MKSNILKDLYTILFMTMLFMFFIISYSYAPDFSLGNDYRMYMFENGSALITKTIKSDKEKNVVISINDLNEVRRTTFYKKDKLLVQEVLEEPEKDNLNSTSKGSIFEGIKNNELTFEYIDKTYKAVEVDKNYLNKHSYNDFDTKSYDGK
ncbi:hypothetical protein KQI42_15350 [Tissierella sp. MSJ-40]|uniref:Uncharacterized protein n=1 Tax=Tissierella simiarum TaxID=2841534 RepID=A0ABS6E900_9FIRM|nr:hypothetical protein [Tissierella simiarum]MBU5439394.1 hypothetical protein [Tissierella simiarum]